MYKHILIPTDGSPLSRKAIKDGIALAKALRARVTGFYSPEQYEVLAYGEYFPPNLISRTEWNERSKQESMSPWQAIVDAARRNKCDLIFMASHGRTGIPGILLGSQAAKVLSHSKIAVLVHKSK